MVARLTPDQKVACSNHVGVIYILFFGFFCFSFYFLLPIFKTISSFFLNSQGIYNNVLYIKLQNERVTPQFHLRTNLAQSVAVEGVRQTVFFSALQLISPMGRRKLVGADTGAFIV